jgi:hypothetical protein
MSLNFSILKKRGREGRRKVSMTCSVNALLCATINNNISPFYIHLTKTPLHRMFLTGEYLLFCPFA